MLLKNSNGMQVDAVQFPPLAIVVIAGPIRGSMSPRLQSRLYLYCKAAIVVGVVLTVSVAGGFLWLRTSLPVTSGSISVPGLQHETEILWDAAGFPRIRAATAEDAYYALGFAHAGDRLFQMDFMRRAGAGRLSEVVGAATVGFDATMRTLGLYRRAEETYRRMPSDARRYIDAYAAGVNGFLHTRSGALPPEFVLLGYRPEAWRPADSLVWARLMAMRLAGNWRTEALRAALIARLDAAQISDLWPKDDDGVSPTVAAATTDPRFAAAFANLTMAIPDALRQVSASNSWAVAGARTASGKPILANDPHLGYRAPGLWYLARITAPGLEIAGATVAGVPFHILGHTDRFAWAFTTTDSDTQDLFVERLSAGRSGHYDTPVGPRPFVVREETIEIKGAAPRKITVRETRHGPVVSDIDRGVAGEVPAGHVVALAAVALRDDDMTPLAILRMNHARDWNGFRAALRHFHAPQQNITFADVDGTVAFLAPGRIPVRRAGDGSVPVPGWSGDYDWQGTVPFDALPQARNPASGRIFSANHRIAPKDYPHLLALDWADPYRARRIEERLSETPPHTVEAAVALQTDILSGSAVDLLPVLLELLDTGDETLRNAAALLAGWDRRMNRGAAAPLVFAAWLAEVNRGLYADELGPLFGAYYGSNPRVVMTMLTRRTGWCDDIATPEKEACGTVVTAALRRALVGLAAKHGTDMAAWQWGDAHPALFRHPVLGRVPLIRHIADIRISADGGDDTVNRAQTNPNDAREPFASLHGPGFRAIYDLSDLGATRFAVATGASGNPLSSHYANTTESWRDGRYLRFARTRTEEIDGARGILRLRPAL